MIFLKLLEPMPVCADLPVKSDHEFLISRLGKIKKSRFDVTVTWEDPVVKLYLWWKEVKIQTPFEKNID